MRLAPLLFALVLTPLRAQDHATLREIQDRLRLIATRAVANFHSAASIESRLRYEGNTLHPQLQATRFRIEAALDDAQASLKAGKLDEANEMLDRAQAWVDRLAHRLGGD